MHTPYWRRLDYLKANGFPEDWAALPELPQFEIGAALPPVFYEHRERLVADMTHAIESAVREALGHWVSELEPVLQFRTGEVFPCGITAKGHATTYVQITTRKITYRITDGENP